MCSICTIFWKPVRTIKIFCVFHLDHTGKDEEEDGIMLQPRYPWEGSDRDYEYEEVYLWISMLLELSFEVDIIICYVFWVLCTINN